MSDDLLCRNRHMSVTVVVLAAGRSTRMQGDNKLLLDLHGKPTILHVLDVVSASIADAVTVVTGHEADDIRNVLSEYDVSFVHNNNYFDGLSTSLCVGISAVSRETAGVLICLGDMPFITVSLIDQLIETFKREKGRRICVPVSRGRRGNPILWPQPLFNHMLNLCGDQGARKLLTQRQELIQEIEVDDDGIHIDLDTPEDFYNN